MAPDSTARCLREATDVGGGGDGVAGALREAAESFLLEAADLGGGGDRVAARTPVARRARGCQRRRRRRSHCSSRPVLRLWERAWFTDADDLGAGVGGDGAHGPADAAADVEEMVAEPGVEEAGDALLVDAGGVAVGPAGEGGREVEGRWPGLPSEQYTARSLFLLSSERKTTNLSQLRDEEAEHSLAQPACFLTTNPRNMQLCPASPTRTWI